MKSTILITIGLMYNLALISGTAYLVQAHGWSMWTFLLTILFFVSPSKVTVEEEVDGPKANR